MTTKKKYEKSLHPKQKNLQQNKTKWTKTRPRIRKEKMNLFQKFLYGTVGLTVSPPTTVVTDPP